MTRRELPLPPHHESSPTATGIEQWIEHSGTQDDPDAARGPALVSLTDATAQLEAARTDFDQALDSGVSTVEVRMWDAFLGTADRNRRHAARVVSSALA